jgi:putative ABC transport system permease protein
MCRSRGPSSVVVLTLAVGIASATIIASTIDRVVHALPIRDTDRLVYVASTDPRPGQAQSGMSDGVALTGTSVPDLTDWAARSRLIEQFAAYRYDTATMTALDPAPGRVSIVRATTTLLTQWGVTPQLGRGFRDDDGSVGAARVALLGHRFWEQRFGSDAGAIGRVVRLNGIDHTIVGVLPASAEGGIFGYKEFWVPQPLDAQRAARDERRLFVTGRMKPGASMEQAQAELSAIAKQLAAEYPATNSNTDVRVRRPIEMLGGEMPFMLMLLGLIATLVIAMACANVSNVVLAQVSARQHELSIRTALGATRLDHVTHIMADGIVLSALAGTLGLLLGGWGLAALKWLAGPEALVFAEATVSWRVMVAAVITSFVVPFAIALLPAIQSWHPAATPLKDGGRTTGRGHRLRRALVAVQIAVAVVLLVQVAFVARAAWDFSRYVLGYDPRQLLTFRTDLSTDRYRDPERVAQFYRRLLTRIDTLPGVATVAAVNRLPVAERELGVKIKVDGAAPVAPDALPMASLSTVSGKYFDTLRIALVGGRRFVETDYTGGQPVALVSARAAQRLWPGRDPIGSRATIVNAGDADLSVVVVGIVANVLSTYADPEPMPQVYIPFTSRPSRSMSFAVRAERGDPWQLLPSIRAQAAALEPDEPLFDALTMEQVLHNDLASTYAFAGMLSAIAMVTLALAVVGIYGVVSYMVVQRTREIGVRVAVGATPPAVQRMLLRDSARPVMVGGVLGAPLAFGLAYAMARAFSFVDIGDPTNYLGVALAIALATLIGSGVPARRAARIDPLRALRSE